jgi:hypothetical protein
VKIPRSIHVKNELLDLGVPFAQQTHEVDELRGGVVSLVRRNQPDSSTS